MEQEVLAREQSLKRITELLGVMCEGWTINDYGPHSPIYVNVTKDVKRTREVVYKGNRKWEIVQESSSKEGVKS